MTSALGKGTTFVVDIPVEFQALDTADFADTDTHGRVLVLDDRSVVFDAVESVVDELGCDLDRAVSAAAAARLLSERIYDAVLLDLDTPIPGSADLLAETRRGDGPNRMAHFISLGATDRAVEIDPNVDVCLSKPIDRSALRRALLGARRRQRPAQSSPWAADD